MKQFINWFRSRNSLLRQLRIANTKNLLYELEKKQMEKIIKGKK